MLNKVKKSVPLRKQTLVQGNWKSEVWFLKGNKIVFLFVFLYNDELSSILYEETKPKDSLDRWYIFVDTCHQLFQVINAI